MSFISLFDISGVIDPDPINFLCVSSSAAGPRSLAGIPADCAMLDSCVFDSLVSLQKFYEDLLLVS